ncbi:MAG: SUMF1/EgtB/PvdO family nonheme iron enzyme [Candidatus Pacebacteria bacterium]|jgi:formylglycine-generating enzyme required for sulfatase activity|nr:SUMF1/EgtB/PvdO family nonheme iron enzyme [Candidatus Paceibacterota bacterium]
MKRFLVLCSIVGVASVLTAGGIRATDYLAATDTICPADMVPVDAVPDVLCVDAFEARATEACLHTVPDSPQATKGNLAISTCIASGDGADLPWRYIAREEAALLCARSGKRLPTAAEWYALALPTSLTDCNFDAPGPVVKTNTTCRTPQGVAQMPGNVWEWVSDDIFDAAYRGRILPPSGYISSVDSDGVATVTSTTSDEAFGADYARIADLGVHGIVRGGFYGSGEDGGIYALQANIAPTFASAGIGFRCVR